MKGCAAFVTGLEAQTIHSQTPYLQTNNANNEGLKGFSGKNLRNAHAREGAGES